MVDPQEMIDYLREENWEIARDETQTFLDTLRAGGDVLAFENATRTLEARRRHNNKLISAYKQYTGMGISWMPALAEMEVH